MWKYAVAKPNGEIISVVSGGFQYVPVSEELEVSDVTHYVSEGAVIEKGDYNLSHDIVDLEVTFVGLPESLKVETNGMETVTDSEPLVIEYDVPGTYTINFSGLVNYLDHEMEVTVG